MNKKETIQALEEKWGVKAVYLGTPTFAYELTTETKTYVIDRNGAIRDPQGQEVYIEELLSEQLPEPANEFMPEEPAETDIDGYAVGFPLEEHTGSSLRNLINMIASKQQLLISAFSLPRSLMDNRFAEELNQKDTENVEAFYEVFLELGSNRCPCIEMNMERRIVRLKLLREKITPDEIDAFRNLAICINENSQKLKHSSFRPAQDDNPKYALRTWLIRLGMNGEKFKATRKVLLAQLEGSSAFRSPTAKETILGCPGEEE